MVNIEDYTNPFDALLDFEDMLSEYTGAPYVVLTDCCTHGIELCLRLSERRKEEMMDNSFIHVELPHRTYLSVPMLMHKLGYEYHYTTTDWEKDDQYPLRNVADDRIYDSARLFKEDMYKAGTYQCLSFGHGKPLQIGAGGAILLHDVDDYMKLKAMSYDGRHIHAYEKWADQQTFQVGYHYHMRPEWAIKGMRMLDDGNIQDPAPFNYPDLREIEIVE